jgi:HEAT repeat protein
MDMKRSSDNLGATKIEVKKALAWLCVTGIVLSIFFLFSSYQVGPVKKMRGIVLLEYVGIKDKRSNEDLINSLGSSDEIEQFNAISAMAYRRYSPENAEALVSYLKSNAGTKRVKIIAVWALGELHAPEANELLYSLKGNMNFDQYEVNKAIKKIEGKIPKPFWRR